MKTNLTYQFNKNAIQISEAPNAADIEFEINITEDSHLAPMKELQKSFEENNIITDVLFYAYHNHQYRVIVRQDYYVDFILGLMKYHLIESVEWS